LSEEERTLSEFLDSVTLESPQEIDLRELLALNGNTKRGKYVVASLNQALRERGLVVEPDLALADYWGPVVISDRRADNRPRHQAGLPISNLAEDAPELITARQEDSLEHVETLMLMHDFSQIPITDQSRRKLHGTVTWKSIARSRANGQSNATARDVMTSGGHVADSADNLMDLIPMIIADDYVYYRNRERVIVGIVTASDLAGTFRNSTGVYVRIGEIESLLRTILDRLPVPDLESCVDPNIERADFGGASDLTFGEYIRVLEHPDRWGALGLGLDRKTCVENLKKVALLRNDIMHFRNTPDDNRESTVTECLNWLKAAI
jgi:CBS domain-containing protein